MARVRAHTEDGPLAGGGDLWVEQTSDGKWPSETVWSTGPGNDERHLYRLKSASIASTGGEPVYVFERTLDPDEPHR